MNIRRWIDEQIERQEAEHKADTLRAQAVSRMRRAEMNRLQELELGENDGNEDHE